MIRLHRSHVVLERHRSPRRGSILTWFAVFLFALLPLITLVVHLGMVTLTRRQMQTAVNTAAIEGLRFRDDGNLSESARRERVRDLVSAVFDDTLDTSDGDALRLGAGPVITFDNEPSDITLPGTEFKAARTIKAGNIGVYDPVLELNEGNEVHGDMLRGTYTPGVGHTEDNDYTRPDGDFTPDATGDAFLVRLRRTDNAGGLDTVAGVSSSGPPIPFLFGRGPYGDSQFLNRRERGTIVRATAIAQQQRVKAVGSPFMAVPGVSPLRILRSHWDDPTFGTVWIHDDGNISSDMAGTIIVGQMIRTTTLINDENVGDTEIQVMNNSGFSALTTPFTILIDEELIEVTNIAGTIWTVNPLTENHFMNANVIRRGVVRVADTESVIPSGDPRGINIPVDSYLPVFESIAGADRVIGFGNVTLPSMVQLPLDASDYPFQLTLTRESNRVASQNAVAVFLGLESHTSLETILNFHDEYDADPMTVPFTNSLTAASLVRTIE